LEVTTPVQELTLGVDFHEIYNITIPYFTLGNSLKVLSKAKKLLSKIEATLWQRFSRHGVCVCCCRL